MQNNAEYIKMVIDIDERDKRKQQADEKKALQKRKEVQHAQILQIEER